MFVVGQRAKVFGIVVGNAVTHIHPQPETFGLGLEQAETLFRIVARIERVGLGAYRIVDRRHLSVFQHTTVQQAHQFQEQRPAFGIGERNQDTRMPVAGRPHLARSIPRDLFDQRQPRRSHKGREQRHDHENHEQRRRDDPHLVTDLQHNQFHQSARIHQHADRQAVLPRLADQPGRERGADHLTGDRHDDEQRADSPQVRRIQQADLRTQTRKDEKQRQKKH